MSQLLQATKIDIEAAYKNHDKIRIHKETTLIQFILLDSLEKLFPDRLNRVTPAYNSMPNKQYIGSTNNKVQLNKWINFLSSKEKKTLTDTEFWNLKVDIENWFYLINDKITFIYQEDYLLSPSQVAEQLSVSRVTVNKYMKQGMENIDTISHNKIPKHVVTVWKNPITALKMQMIYQSEKLKTNTAKNRFIQVAEDIAEYQNKYNAVLAKEIIPNNGIDYLEDSIDYYDWRQLEVEKKEITKGIEYE